MLNKLLFIIMLAAATNAFADEAMRVNMKSAIVKGCVAGAGKEITLKDLNTEEYCGCTANGLIDDLTDDELKQVFLGGDKALLQAKMNSGAALCISTNSGAAAFVKSAMNKGCMEKPSSVEGPLNKEAYCTCVADKFSLNISQEDMQDAIAIGQGTSKLINTNVANKVMSVAAECMNQTVKQ